MRGDAELVCLNVLKRVMFKPTALFAGKYSLLSNEEIIELSSLLLTARPNPEASLFPDFVSDRGFIEHFRVTSTVDNRKGSEFSIMLSSMDKERDAFVRGLSLPEVPSGIYSKSISRVIPKASYESFVLSFKKHWLKHMTSCDKYVAEHVGLDACVFMVDNGREFNLSMFCVNSIDGFPRKVRGYVLSLDNNLLRWIANNAGCIKYVIFCDGFGHDIVSVARIPELIARNGCGYTVYDMPGISDQYTICMK